MLEFIILFILKIMDCSLSTVKTIFLIKDKNFMSSLFNAFSTYFYLVMITKLAKSNSNIAVIIICIATFIGSFLPTLIFNKLEKDSVYVFDIIFNNNEEAKEIADDLRNNNLAVQTYTGYNFNKEKVLCCKVFTENKKQSILLEECLPKDKGITYHVVEIKKQVNFNN